MKLIHFIAAVTIASTIAVPSANFAQSATLQVYINVEGQPPLLSQTVQDPSASTNINSTFLLEPNHNYTLNINGYVNSHYYSFGLGSAGYKASLHLTATFDQTIPFADQDILHAWVAMYDGQPYVELSTNFTHYPSSQQTFSISQNDPQALSSAHGSYSVISNGNTLQFDGNIDTDSSGGNYNTGEAGFSTSMPFSVSHETSLSLVGTMSASGRGWTQNYPVLPSRGAVANHYRFDTWSGRYIDPPLADSFEFQMIGGSLFTDILEFPTGIIATNKQFEVWVNHSSLGKYSAGQGVNFVSLLGSGVTNFVVSGIIPSVDAGNPEAFPIKLAFNTPTASFTMTPIPLPTLSIQMLNSSTVQLNWMTNVSAYLLESADTLSQYPWTTVTNSPALIGDEYSVTVGTTVWTRFYRLKKP